MKITIGNFTLTVALEHRSTNLRKAVLAEIPRGKVYAIKRAREIKTDMSLREAVEYVNSLVEIKK